MVPTLAAKNLVSKRPPMGKYPTRGCEKLERDIKWDSDVTETLIEVTPQVRRAFKAIVDTDELRDSIIEEQEKFRRMKEENASRLAAMQTITMTAIIEITPTETGRSKCITCLSCRCCLACVSLETKVNFPSRWMVPGCVGGSSSTSEATPTETWIREGEGWWEARLKERLLTVWILIEVLI